MTAPARRSAETTVTTIGGVATRARAPGPAPVVRSKVTEDSLKDPKQVARFFAELYREIDALRTAQASVLSGSTFFRDVVLAVGVNYFRHGLGRVPFGVMATLATTAPTKGALPAAYDPATFVNIINNDVVPVTVSLMVF